MQVYYFIAIQLLDLLTTLLFLKFGLTEGNPFLRFVLKFNFFHIFDAIIYYKVLLSILFGIFLYKKKPHLMNLLNGFFLLIPIWNVGWMLYSIR